MHDERSDAIAPTVARKARPAFPLRVGLAVAGVVAVAIVLVAGPGATSVWYTVQTNADAWHAWAGRHTLFALAAFFAVYALCAALPLPVPTVMSLLAGALFGRAAGTAVAALAYTTGVTVAFLAARWLLRERVRRRAGAWLRRVERGVARDGALYLLALRLMPSVPFFLVNVLMALTPIRTRTYALASGVGVLPATFLYAGVGTELAGLRSPSDALSAPLVASLAALAVVPLLARKLLPRARESETTA